MGFIYSVRNKVNGKYYIGKTTQTLEKRKQQHLRDARHEKDNYHFHLAIRKYGEENFEWEIIDEHEDERVLNALERLHIARYESLEDGYNMVPGGYGVGSGENNPNYGKRGEETSMYGKHHTEEARQKMSENNWLKKPENREKHPMYGKHHTEESKRKMSEAGKGRQKSKEHKRNIGKAHRGRGLFGFTGGYYAKKKQNPWTKVWVARINYNGKGMKSLGCFQDPLSCQLVHDFAWHEIYDNI